MVVSKSHLLPASISVALIILCGSLWAIIQNLITETTFFIFFSQSDQDISSFLADIEMQQLWTCH